MIILVFILVQSKHENFACYLFLESSIQVKEEKTGNNEEYKLKGNSSIPGVKAGAIKASKVGKFFENDIHAPTEAKGINLGNSVRRKRRQKSLPSKVRMYCLFMDINFLFFFTLSGDIL